MISKWKTLALAVGTLLLTSSPAWAEHKPNAIGRYWRDFAARKFADHATDREVLLGEVE